MLLMLLSKVLVNICISGAASVLCVKENEYLHLCLELDMSPISVD